MRGDPAEWRKLQSIFEAALELNAGRDREAFLDHELSGSPELQREARNMLRAHENGLALEIETRLLNEGGETGTVREGDCIGPYKLERLLGRGGMGEVYLAERCEPEFRQQVALKLLRAGWRGPDATARFRLERRILAKLNHPSIVPLLDGGVTADGRPYLVLQYVEGRTITEYCGTGDVPVRRRLALIREVARAVEYAHRNLVVHRDLKPSNILVTGEGEVRLLDFGIAKLLDPSPDEIAVPATKADWRLMTPEYAAPEQILGEPVTTATDIHALGVLMYEMLAGQRPFVPADGSRREMERQIVEEDPAPPSKRAPHPGRLGGDLDAIALKALKKDPGQRYSSAAELAAEIERYLSGEPVQARGPSLGYRFGKLVRRNRMASALAAGCIVLALGFGVTAFHQSRRIARERDLARSEQRKTEKVVELLVGLFASSNPRNTPKGSELTVREFLLESEANILRDQSLDPGVQARLKHLLGEAYGVRGQFQEARTRLEDALRQSRAVHGENHPTTAAIHHDLARLIAESESPAKAVPLLRESHARHRLLFGDHHEKVAASLAALGSALPVSEERRRLLEESLAMRRSLEAKPGAGVASSLNALGVYYYLAGNPEQAVRRLEEALEILRQTYGEGHPANLQTAINLAAAYSRHGRFDKAAGLEAALVESSSRLLGPERSAVVLGNLGVDLAQMGDYANAEAAFRRALDLQVKLFGPIHTHVANTIRNLGRMRQMQGDYRKANELLRQAIDVHRRSGGSEGVLRGMEGQYASILLRQGRRPEALRKLAEAVESLKAMPGKGNESYLADVEVLLGYALLESAAAPGAEAHFREALAFRRANLPAGHPRIAEAECGLWAALAVQKRSSEREASVTGLPTFRAWALADPANVKLVERLRAE